MHLRRLSVVCALLAILTIAAAALADLRDYAPLQVTCLTSATTLLASDNQLKVVQLTNVGDYDVWFCSAGQTPEVNKGFLLPAKSTVTLDGDQCPQLGLKGIASGGSSVVAIGRG